jgi:RsiW-degrading membrane proteinase PrsW (M82 family)
MSHISNLLLFLLAILPTAVIMFLVIRNAKFKREPAKKIASVMAISALSVIPAIILELVGDVILVFVFAFLDINVRSDEAGLTIYYLFEYLLVVGTAEEACKFFTFKWIIFNDREFDNTYDGVIYGAASALGFATLENIMYIFMDENPLSVALMRAVLSVPMHAITGIFMGYYFGISKYRRYNNVQADTRPERPAYIFSVILHGFYDFIVTMPGVYEDSTFVTVFSWILIVIIMIGIYFLMGFTIRRAKRESHNIYNRYYYEQLGGNFQDMLGGKTSARRPMFFGMPLPMFYRNQPGMFNPYNPYASMGAAPPPPQQYNQGYQYGTQQPYNPYMQYNPNQYQNNPYQNPYAAPPQQYYQQTRTAAAPTVPNPNAAPPKFCRACGAKLSETARFCNVCGNEIKKT